ncbi:metal ABC transporter ATP-binding protein [Rickettsia endosymbiont of Cardiosporidium cionae]|uniref:metal ABC transporter ATP-binding protein n=1 Tax=Rickettsia endosymbiont of Cardiosporidium cionae TaxID=2777155 RepID=UPI0018963700|nr:metal ABC transporter ATP-binding protein [Rickettsia endosymbiont of Cardiosporidium cionae]KAF8818722.1 metal ABC transporter ATP-binding protein [Rickettsia endosymbiont of Cardiosporidium cionae]
MNLQPIIRFKSLSKYFDQKLILDKINIDIIPGEITTLIGQNGSGKTTIAKIILGLETSYSGEFYKKNNLKIEYLPQKLDMNFNMPINAKTLIKILTKTNLELSDELLNFISYKKIKNQDLSKLSGGELQKLYLLCTIVNQADLIILDEPTQYLDLTSQQNFYKILKNRKAISQTSILMISHDLFTVMKNSDRVICLNKHICCSGKPSEMQNNLDFKKALSEIGMYIHGHDHEH